MAGKTILEVQNLTKFFNTPGGQLHAVDGVSFKIEEGRTLGIVGESGCGKSTTGRTILKLLEPTGGKILFDGKDITNYSRKQMRPLRQEMQMVFQDPFSSLDPRQTVMQLISEPIIEHKLLKSKSDIEERTLELMRTVGLAERYMNVYPHELDGGRRQRIGIARALAVRPKLIVCDEPVSALDVSIQSQIINLMKDMQEEKNISYIFISHDLSVVKHISDRVGVMYLGSMMELADKNEIYSNPQHPYTRALIGAIPLPDPTKRKEMQVIQGEIPSNVNIPKGCKFNPRCPFAKDICREQEPATKEVKPNHFVKCHFGGEF